MPYGRTQLGASGPTCLVRSQRQGWARTPQSELCPARCASIFGVGMVPAMSARNPWPWPRLSLRGHRWAKGLTSLVVVPRVDGAAREEQPNCQDRDKSPDLKDGADHAIIDRTALSTDHAAQTTSHADKPPANAQKIGRLSSEPVRRVWGME